MNNLKIIKALVSGNLNWENCQIADFATPDLRELTSYFGKGIEWQGKFKAVPHLVEFVNVGDEPCFDDWDLCGLGFDDGSQNVFLYRLTE
jgi:hypothetical protein